jgi:hypothetical protein
MKEFQVGDDVQLRDGREARVLAVFRIPNTPST